MIDAEIVSTGIDIEKAFFVGKILRAMIGTYRSENIIDTFLSESTKEPDALYNIMHYTIPMNMYVVYVADNNAIQCCLKEIKSKVTVIGRESSCVRHTMRGILTIRRPSTYKFSFLSHLSRLRLSSDHCQFGKYNNSNLSCKATTSKRYVSVSPVAACP